jgi:hypothetical protein
MIAKGFMCAGTRGHGNSLVGWRAVRLLIWLKSTAGGLGGLPAGESAGNWGRISVVTGFRRCGVLIAASAIMIGAGIGAATLAAGAAHAQGSGSITITGVSTNGFGEAQFPVVTVSVTCPANDRFIVGASTMQSATSLGSTANAFCTGNAVQHHRCGRRGRAGDCRRHAAIRSSGHQFRQPGRHLRRHDGEPDVPVR